MGWLLIHYVFYHSSQTGYLDDDWVGPQVLAHHILLSLTNDLYVEDDARWGPDQKLEDRNCPHWQSLLFGEIYPSRQFRDECVNKKLNRSKIPAKQCLRINN